jgi:hypothetical protein
VSISAALKRSAGAIEGRASFIRARERLPRDAGSETARSRVRHVNCKEM